MDCSVGDPLELLAESCKRICPASVKPLQTTDHNLHQKQQTSESDHDTNDTNAAQSTTIATTGGSENRRRSLEADGGPATTRVERTVSTDCNDEDGKANRSKSNSL